MEQKKLWDELSKGVIGNLYLLYGDERFLVRHYASSIEKAALDQDPGVLKDIFEGNTPVKDVATAVMTLPFLASKKLVFVKDSMLFVAGRKNDSEALADFLPDIPEETILIFIESEVDKRLRCFKKIQELGRAVECESQSTQDLVKWITRTMKGKGKDIPHATASALLATCGGEMEKLHTEMEKLASYVGDSKEVTPDDIQSICTQTLESRIFSLTKAMGEGNAPKALKEFSTMLALKESPIMILTMIIRQLRIILLVKCGTEKRLPRHQIAKDVGIRDFVINEALSHAARFTNGQLVRSLGQCMETDIKIKTGLMSPEIGVEMLLAAVISPQKTDIV